MYVRPLAAPALLAAMLVACTDAPTGLQSIRTAGANTPDDSTSAAVPASVQVRGQVLGVRATEPVSGSTDTLRHEPVRHARITVKRNILVNGQSAQELAATLSADAEGRFRLDDLAGGYYIVEASAPGSAYRDGWEYLPATQSAVQVTVYLWQRP